MYRDNGKENGNYSGYIKVYKGYTGVITQFRVKG